MEKNIVFDLSELTTFLHTFRRHSTGEFEPYPVELFCQEGENALNVVVTADFPIRSVNYDFRFIKPIPAVCPYSISLTTSIHEFWFLGTTPEKEGIQDTVKLWSEEGLVAKITCVAPDQKGLFLAGFRNGSEKIGEVSVACEPAKVGLPEIPYIVNDKFKIRHDETGTIIGRKIGGSSAWMLCNLRKAGDVEEMETVISTLVRTYVKVGTPGENFLSSAVVPKVEEKLEVEVPDPIVPPQKEEAVVADKVPVVRRKKSKVDAPVAPDPVVSETLVSEVEEETSNESEKEGNEEMATVVTPAASVPSPAPAPVSAAEQGEEGKKVKRRSSEEVLQEKLTSYSAFLKENGYAVVRREEKKGERNATELVKELEMELKCFTTSVTSLLADLKELVGIGQAAPNEDLKKKVAELLAALVK